VPLPGNIPAEYETPIKGFKPPEASVQRREKSLTGEDITSIPRWVKH